MCFVVGVTFALGLHRYVCNLETIFSAGNNRNNHYARRVSFNFRAGRQNKQQFFDGRFPIVKYNSQLAVE